MGIVRGSRQRGRQRLEDRYGNSNQDRCGNTDCRRYRNAGWHTHEARGGARLVNRNYTVTGALSLRRFYELYEVSYKQLAANENASEQPFIVTE
jgi:hypothetical protein